MNTLIVFLLLSLLAIFAAAMMITNKNPVFSILWLIVVFFCISGHYILMNAQFLAVVNIIVYAGAIMVLFLFVIMLMNLNKDNEPIRNQRRNIIGIISGLSLLGVLMIAVKMNHDPQPILVKTGESGLIENLGKTLFTSFVLPFELASVLFLSAMVGAVIIGKKDI